MVEKYRGAIPPNSIWYKLSRDESLALLKHNGEIAKMTPEQISTIESSDIQAIRGQVDDLEKMLKEAGLNIVTLFD